MTSRPGPALTSPGTAAAVPAYTDRMGSPVPALRRSAATLAVLAAASCSAGTGPAATEGSSTAAASGPVPLTAEISQFRDNYGRQIIEIQLTNTTGAPVTVLGVGLDSPLFASGIGWKSAAAGTEIPPGQTKSLPARLPAASCAAREAAPGPPAATPGATVEIRSAAAAGTATEFIATAATDPFGVLVRNNAEMCLAQAANAVATFRFSPDLEVAADARTAVLRLLITPRRPAGAVDGRGGSLTIATVGGTTLLEEDAGAPWPRALRVDASGPEQELRLGIRPARCDPHAVAEDKVGTLIPLHVTVDGQEGVLKVAAGEKLRGLLHDFVTSACGRQ